MLMHIKRLNAPKHFPIRKKEMTFTVTPRAGPHKRRESLPLQIVIRDILGHGRTAREAKHIIGAGDVLVDGRKRKDYAYPAGLMDILEIPKTKEKYIILPKKTKLSLVPTGEGAEKLCKITGKKYVKGGKTQLSMHDGRNMVVDDGKKYSVGDTVKISLPDQKFKKHFSLEKGKLAMIVEGRHSGSWGKVDEIEEVISSQPNRAVIDVLGKKIRTRKSFLFVIGDSTPEIALEEAKKA